MDVKTLSSVNLFEHTDKLPIDALIFIQKNKPNDTADTFKAYYNIR